MSDSFPSSILCSGPAADTLRKTAALKVHAAGEAPAQPPDPHLAANALDVPIVNVGRQFRRMQDARTILRLGAPITKMTVGSRPLEHRFARRVAVAKWQLAPLILALILALILGGQA